MTSLSRYYSRIASDLFRSGLYALAERSYRFALRHLSPSLPSYYRSVLSLQSSIILCIEHQYSPRRLAA